MQSNITSCTRYVGEKTGDDYTYDVNGNITKDYNRHMHTPANGNGAVYNLLDKPDSMVIANRATLYYYYDAAGNKLRKQVNDYTTGKTLNYLYIDGFVYLNDTLQYVNTEEGRIRWSVVGSQSSFVYDYYLRDHLGNVRTVLTEQKDTSFYPPASLETANLATEKLYYSGEDSGRVNKSTIPGYPSDTYTSPNDYIQQLSGSGFKTGTGIVLKVMAGDQFNIRASSWYKTNGATPGAPVGLLANLLSALTANVGGITGTHGGATAAQLQSSGVFIPGATSFLNNQVYNSSIPKAYLNWVLFDDQFKMVSSSSGAQQVGADNTFTPMVQNGLSAAKNGYLYVYVSNETPNINVYFDNLQVTHIKGPLLQEQSYYPFGLQMAGISDNVLGKLDSKNKFNGGVELEEDYGVNLYSTFYRQYDPQIGRFGGVDVLSEKSAGMSVYQFGGNNPVMFNDPSGALSQADWNDFLGKLGTGVNLDGFGDYGGNYSSSGGGGFTSYSSDAQSFAVGAGYMDAHNLWGTNGFAGSLDAAQNYYYNHGGTDGEVRGVQPTIIIRGTYNNGNFNVTGTTWNWNGNKMSSEGWSALGGEGNQREGSGQESNGWENAKGATELTDMGLGYVDYLQAASRSAQMIEGGSEIKMISETAGRATGVGLSIASGILTTIDAEQKYGHLRNSDKADLGIDLAEGVAAAFEVSSPIGWAFGVGMFVGNLISEHYTGKSITENLFANDNN